MDRPPVSEWETLSDGGRATVLPDGRHIRIVRSSNGNPPGVGGMAVASPSTWMSIDGGEWVGVPKTTLQETLANAADPAWVDRMVEDHKRYAVTPVDLPEPPKGIPFQGAHDTYQIFLVSAVSGYVQNSAGKLIAHFHRQPSERFSVRPAWGTTLPAGLARFIESLP